jgi:Xaa-Pro aminopeptidase
MQPDRLSALRHRLRERELPAIILTEMVNIGYVTGFTGSNAVVIVTPDDTRFITDSRYSVQAGEQCPGFTLRTCSSSAGMLDSTVEQVNELGLTRLAFEADHVAVSRHAKWQEKLPQVEWLAASEVVETLRMIKDEGELARIRAAVVIVDRTFEHILPFLKPGAAERDIAIEIEHFMKRQGAEKEAFDTIVASGARSAMPHGRASEKPLAVGDFVTMDFGARWDGYHSDLTRTVVIGKASDRQREIYGLVREAQEAGLRGVRAGVTGVDADAAARKIIEAAGHGDHFGHGLGHGLGRTVHDGGSLSPRSDITLAAGMVMTVEPGVYIDGWGGVRIEDDVVVTETGCEVLTRSTKVLLEV